MHKALGFVKKGVLDSAGFKFDKYWIKKNDLKNINFKTKDTFKKLSKDDISFYCSTGEPINRAGGYAIQGKGAILIKKLEGSYSGVMGLPLEETYQLLSNYS